MAGGQAGQVAAGGQLPVGQNQDAGADGLHLAEDMAGQDDGVAFAQLLDQAAHLNHLRRVQPHGGLIQNDDLGAAQQRLGDAHPLAVPFGQVADQPGHHAGQAGAAGRLFHLGLPPGPAHPFQGGGKAEVFLHRHFGVEGRRLGQIAHAGPGGVRLLGQRVAADRHRPAGGGQVAGQDIHNGGLARPVGPQQAVDLPVLHREGQVFDRRPRAVHPCQMGYFDHWQHLSFRSMAIIDKCRAQMCSKWGRRVNAGKI